MSSTLAVGLRLSPPEPGRELMLRPRLLAVLRSRFQSRLTTVTAGPGFGKTSLVAQAVAENKLAPCGSDVWLTCREADTAASSLASALFTAFRLRGISSWDPRVVTERIIAQIWGHSPEQVALILDEAHLVTAGSKGAAMLSELLRHMPGNGHLVLVGRDRLPLATARLAADGQLTKLREADLAFTSDELAEFADLRSVPPETLDGLGGWPALAELSASTSGERVLDYLWEELLASLPDDRRRDLAALTLLAPIDDAIAVALTGHAVDLTATLADLPLVFGRPGTERSLHPLWQSALAHELSAGEVAAARARAAAELRQRGDVGAAVRLLATAERWDDVREIACETALHTHPLVAPDVIEQWYRCLPEAERRSPEGVLLQALVARAHDLAGAVPLFTHAADRFREANNVVGEVAALTHAAHIAWWLDDLAGVDIAVERVEHLADQFPWLLGRAALGRVLAADAKGEFGAALEVLTRIPDVAVTPAMKSGVEWLWAWEYLFTGTPEQATMHAAAAVDDAPGTFLAPALNVQLLALWQAGRISEALDLLPRFAGATDATDRDLGTVFERSQCALLLAFAGQVEDAQVSLTAARSALSGAGQAAMAEISFALGCAAVEVAVGDENGARALLAAELEARPLAGDGRTRWHRMFPALSYVLVPATRDVWNAQRLGPAQAFSRDLAKALVAVRESEDVKVAARLDLAEPGRIRAQLPLPWVVEVGVSALAGGSATARELLDSLAADCRQWLWRLATDSPLLARTAKSLLAQMPRMPGYRLELRVLGPLELSRDGVLVDHPDLRRDRVRQLLQYLVVTGPVSRSAVGATLWPDLPPEGAARNLRVTLAYVQRVLEPDRREGDPPTFLRTDGGMLALRASEDLRVDLYDFVAELNAAKRAERQAAPSVALAHLTRALPWYRAECFVELAGTDWADLERDRLQFLYVNAAVRAGELLIATGDLETPVELAVKALRADPCSEAAHRLLVAVHLERGEIDGARQAHRRCLRMLAELGLPPEPRTEMLARRMDSARGRPSNKET